MNTGKPDPDFKKMSLIERSALTFESFLNQEYSNRFYREEFLNGISARRIEIHFRLGKIGGTAFMLATIIAFFDLLSGAFSYSGVTIRLTQDLAPVVALFCASALFGMTTSFIDDQIISRFLIKLGANINIQSFPIFLIDKMAINIWGDAIVPRYFGDKSGTGHKAAMIAALVVGIVTFIFFYLYPVLMIGKVSYDVFVLRPESRWVAKLISGLSLLMVVWTTLLGIIFSVRFKFYPADFHESTDKPTDHFIKAMQEKMAEPGSEFPTSDGDGKTT